MSYSDDVLDALEKLISGAVNVPVYRNEVVPHEIPSGGIIILRDGDPGNPETTLCPVIYEFEWRAGVEIYVQAASHEKRNDPTKAIKSDIGSAIAADRRLGGLVHYTEASAPQNEEVPVEGGKTIKVTQFQITLEFDVHEQLF